MPITTTPSGGPQGEFSTYTPIYSTTLSSNTSSVTLSNIPQNYTDLVLVASARRGIDNAGGAGAMIFNEDGSSLYSTTIMYNSGNTLFSSRWTDAVGLYGGFATADGASCVSTTHIMNYSNNTIFKSYIGNRGQMGNDPRREISSGLWRSTSPINSITLSSANNIVSGATITLYGVKAAATQFIPTKAAGGDIVVTDGTYAYHAFLSSGVFSAAQSLTCDFMMVGGGGGGGHAGGGAGGFRLLTSQSFTAAQYPVVVGAGGVGNGYGDTVSSISNGTSTTFKGTTATYGGGGGNQQNSTNADGQPGGSGGGEGYGRSQGLGASDTAGTGNLGGFTPVEGYAGGLGKSDNSTFTAGGGGGGAGGAGATTSNSTGGAGGVGAGGTSYTNYTIINSMAAATRTGVLSSGNYYYAGGGGGNGTNQGAGGIGGGGQGATGSYGSAILYRGQQLTGGGGGGANSDSVGAAGGSGLVIVRYLL